MRRGRRLHLSSYSRPPLTIVQFCWLPFRLAALQLSTKPGSHTDSIGDYVAEIERVTSFSPRGVKRIVISGAFPDCEPEFQQNLSSAVHAVSEAALRAGVGLSIWCTSDIPVYVCSTSLDASDRKISEKPCGCMCQSISSKMPW